MSAKKAQNTDNHTVKTTPVIARLEDGTVQITLTIPASKVQEKQELALKHLIENLEIPGFRKGKAPTDVAVKHIEKQKLFEYTLDHLLPEAYSQVVEDYNLKPITNPRFELISANDNEDWSIRAIICELPIIDLGDYKKTIASARKTNNIWVPGKDKEEKEPANEEKEQLVIKTLLETVEVKIPKPLIEDEVNHRLSQLLDQIQKIGLTIEQYLSSTGKNIDQLRTEYELQANESIKLLLVLNKVAEIENLSTNDSEVEQIFKTSLNAIGETNEPSAEQRRYIKSILLRRKALDSLTSLI